MENKKSKVELLAYSLREIFASTGCSNFTLFWSYDLPKEEFHKTEEFEELLRMGFSRQLDQEEINTLRSYEDLIKTYLDHFEVGDYFYSMQKLRSTSGE